MLVPEPDLEPVLRFCTSKAPVSWFQTGTHPRTGKTSCWPKAVACEQPFSSPPTRGLNQDVGAGF